jgi:hypothetical protein
MKEINLDQLFQELNQEATEVQISEITEWVNNIQTPGFRFKIVSSIVGLSIILVVIYSFFRLNEQNLVIKTNKTISVLPIENLSPSQLVSPKKETTLEASTFKIARTKIDVMIPIEPVQVFNFDKLPLKSLNSNQSTVLKETNASKSWLMDLMKIQNRQAIVFDSLIPQQNSLFILDTVQNYRSNRKLGMDENDCYLQILNDYVVISYRFRGATVFKSGKIYETGTMKLDGKEIRIYGFVCDNRYSQANFGQRNFFGVTESSGNTTEVVFFGFNWNPMYIIQAHPASELERKGLLDRSEKQKNL